MCLIEKELWCRAVLESQKGPSEAMNKVLATNAAPGFRKHHESERGENMEMKNEA
jgi:hypothetical protein